MAYKKYSNDVLDLEILLNNNQPDTRGLHDTTPLALHNKRNVQPRLLKPVDVKKIDLDQLAELSMAISAENQFKDWSGTSEEVTQLLKLSSNTHDFVFNAIAARSNERDAIKVVPLDGERIGAICQQIKSNEMQEKYVDKLTEIVATVPGLTISNISKLKECRYFDKLLRVKRRLAKENTNHDLFWASKVDFSRLVIAEKHIAELGNELLLTKSSPFELRLDESVIRKNSALVKTLKGVKLEALEMTENSTTSSEENSIVTELRNFSNANQEAIDKLIRNSDKKNLVWGIGTLIGTIGLTVTITSILAGSMTKNIQESTDAQINAIQSSTKASVDAIEKSTKASVDAIEKSTKASVDAIEKSTDAKVDAIEKSTDSKIDAILSKIGGN